MYSHFFVKIKLDMKANSNYKLYATLRKLSPKEIKQLKKLLKSPFFVLRNDIGELFEYLSKYVLKDKPFPDKEQVFKYIFPDKKFDYGLLRATMSTLLGLIEEYFLILKQRSSTIRTRHLLAEIYRERDLSKSYQGVVKKTAELLEKYPQRNEFYYRQLLDFQLEEMEFLIENERTKYFDLGNISNTIDIHYLVQKLKHTCAQFSHKQVYNADYDFGLLSHLLAPIEQEKYLSIPAVGIYYYCYRFLTEPEGNTYFMKFKEMLFKNKKYFDSYEIKVLHLHAINYCIRELNKGHTAFGNEILDLYKDGLAGGYLLENGQISQFSYNNIVAAGTRLEEFDWSEKFIQNYANFLDPEHRDRTISFNLARLEYSRKNYDKAMVHLQNSEYKEVLNTLIAKSIITRIYYEQKNIDALFSHLDSFQIYVRRKEVSEFYRTNYLNNIRFVRKLVAFKGGKKQKEILKSEFEAEKILTERSWLLEKLNEI